MTINTTLKELKKQMDDTYTKIAKESREDYIGNLKPGDSMPPDGKIMSAAYLEKFNEEASAIQHKVYSAIDEERERLSKQMAAAPTTEAVNAISLLKLRSDLTPGDIDHMLATYGSNYSAHKAIVSIAKDAGVRADFPAHKYDVAADGLDFVQTRAADSFSAGRYAREGCTVASTCGWDTICDNELPD